MAEWRLGREWAAHELARRLDEAARLRRNFDIDEGLSTAHGWNRHASRAVIAREALGRPAADGPFERGWTLVQQFAFSDPRIVRAHFDHEAPLMGRRMLLEIRVLGLHYLGATVVGAVRDDSDGGRTLRGYRYDTLEGHIERGCEWFLVAKNHATGEVTFTVRAAWQHGELPNVWSRIGFRLLVRRYQRAWHRLAHLRLWAMLGSVGLDPLPRPDRLVDEGWAPTIAAAHAALSARPEGIVGERDEKGRSREAEMMRQLGMAFGFGMVSGSRSMLAPALVSQSFATSHDLLERRGPAADLLTRPRVVQLLPLLAAGEVVADKLPWTPPRTQAISLAGRTGSGALVGAAIAAPENRAAAAIAGAAGALAATYGLYHLRRMATERRVPGWLAALTEDALAFGFGLLLLRRGRLRRQAGAAEQRQL
jgi:uncharacterized membrane protein/uncharacterized protein (UPF0548 family)